MIQVNGQMHETKWRSDVSSVLHLLLGMLSNNYYEKNKNISVCVCKSEEKRIYVWQKFKIIYERIREDFFLEQIYKKIKNIKVFIFLKKLKPIFNLDFPKTFLLSIINF